ncbi:MAG: aminopeptidase [Anaerolineae bacterium]|jgi:leucyl aminopeptidase (aminopeptidase T)
MKNEIAAQNGARKIVETCLGLASGQELLILFDETTVPVANTFLDVAYEVGVHAAALYVPTSIQVHLDQAADLPLTMVCAIREATSILTCVTDDQICLPFRNKIFDVGLDSRSKIGHMPGVTIDILPMANADYQQIRADCEFLASVLLKGHDLDLITHDAGGRPYGLKVGIGGWERPPAISDGLIERGGWANIPPGETFVAPMEGTAEGCVVVDGSLPGYVIPHGGEIKLWFEAGRLVRYESDDARCLEIVDDLRAFARARDDIHWSNLAEIGLGTNPAVELTGIELLDEKKYGTAHIALGENNWFGGVVSSAIHTDWIIRNPIVRVDGREIVSGGQIHSDRADWQEAHQRLVLDPAWFDGLSTVSRSGVRGDRSTGLLRREWIDARGNPYYAQVGNDATATKAAQIYGQIPPIDGRIELEVLLAANPDLGRAELGQLLHLMDDYELLRLT